MLARLFFAHFSVSPAKTEKLRLWSILLLYFACIIAKWPKKEINIMKVDYESIICKLSFFKKKTEFVHKKTLATSNEI